MVFTTGNDIPGKLFTDCSQKEMIFLGEYLHNSAVIHDYKDQLVIGMAKISDFRLLARESVYCLHPVVEYKSLQGMDSEYISPAITEYNRSTDEHHIVVTAIDIAHSIKHTPRLVKEFIKAVISKNSREDVKPLFSALSDQSVQLETREDKEQFIADLKEVTGLYKNLLDPEVLEELVFYTDLLTSSLNHIVPQDRETYIRQADERNRLFIETVRRAVLRNSKKKLRIICDVGAPHAYKKYISEESDYYVGLTPEARYFDDVVYPGRVHSVLIRPFYLDYYGKKTETVTNPVEREALRNMGSEQIIYVDLHRFRDEYGDSENPQYYDKDGFQFDGIIFLRNDEHN